MWNKILDFWNGKPCKHGYRGSTFANWPDCKACQKEIVDKWDKEVKEEAVKAREEKIELIVEAIGRAKERFGE